MPDPQPQAPTLDAIPEMEIEVLIRIMRTSFSIVHESVEGKPYAIRFIGSPFNVFVEDCRHIQVFTHNRGRTISPHNIKAILAKFDIPERDFIEAAMPTAAKRSVIDTSAADSKKGAKPN